MNKLRFTEVTLGTDPEAFYAVGKNIIGSEKIIPIEGIAHQSGSIHRDGVQFELHPNEGPVKHLVNCTGHLLTIAFALAKNFPDTSISFDGLVEVSRKELDSLSPACRVLGCMPSKNIYGHKDIDVDPIAYQKRSAGGHIHIGIDNAVAFKNRQKLVPLMDRLVGNTCVLLDRDPGAAERRENYGRAGEYRTPKHGLEYRTISNFWLRDPVLMDFTFGLANIAISAFYQAADGDKEPWAALMDCVKNEDVVLAINNNDFQLAMSNFVKMSKVLREILPISGFVLNPALLGNFQRWAVQVNREGIEKFFQTRRIAHQWAGRQKQTFRWWIA